MFSKTFEVNQRLELDNLGANGERAKEKTHTDLIGSTLWTNRRRRRGQESEGKWEMNERKGKKKNGDLIHVGWTVGRRRR